jgi:hypothetical protein
MRSTPAPVQIELPSPNAVRPLNPRTGPTFKLRQAAPEKTLPTPREWWRDEARRTRTDWSSLLRQRIRVLNWVRAGRPPLSKWHAETPKGER